MKAIKPSWLQGVAWILILAHSPAFGQAPQPVPFAERNIAQKTALVTGATICSLVYTPMKAVYAAGGVLAGGMVYLMSAGQSSMAARQIVNRSSHGDWFVSPDHLTQSRSIRFNGDGLPPPGTSR